MINNDDDISPASRPQNEYVNGYIFFKDECPHYKNNYSINIFPCCDKPYPCYKCHDKNESHTYKSANKGYCRDCKYFWENGKITKCPSCGANFP